MLSYESSVSLHMHFSSQFILPLYTASRVLFDRTHITYSVPMTHALMPFVMNVCVRVYVYIFNLNKSTKHSSSLMCLKTNLFSMHSKFRLDQRLKQVFSSLSSCLDAIMRGSSHEQNFVLATYLLLHVQSNQDKKQILGQIIKFNMQK